jgi:hypothetical protein
MMQNSVVNVVASLGLEDKRLYCGCYFKSISRAPGSRELVHTEVSVLTKAKLLLAVCVVSHISSAVWGILEGRDSSISDASLSSSSGALYPRGEPYRLSNFPIHCRFRGDLLNDAALRRRLIQRIESNTATLTNRIAVFDKSVNVLQK